MGDRNKHLLGQYAVTQLNEDSTRNTAPVGSEAILSQL